MSVIYAQIDSDSKICFAVSRLAETIESSDMIELEKYDIGLIGKRWTGSEWEDVPSETQSTDVEAV